MYYVKKIEGKYKELFFLWIYIFSTSIFLNIF